MRKIPKQLAALLFACFITIVGCASGEGPIEDPYNPQNPHNQDTYLLYLMGYQTLTMQSGQQANLQVRYSKNNHFAIGQEIQFVLKGDYKDSRLSTFKALTKEQGVATTVLVAGQQPASFQVEAHAANTLPTLWEITVQVGTDPPSQAKKMVGTYEVQSQFNIQGDFQGASVADVLNVLNDITDDPKDPGKFLVDLVLDEIADDNKTLRSVALLIAPTLYKEVNELLNQNSSVWLPKITQIVQGLSTVARQFRLESDLQATSLQDGDRNMFADHSLTKIGWNLHGNATMYSFSELGLPPSIVNAVQLTPGNDFTNVSIVQHSFDLKFGAFLLVALNNVIIPHLDPSANNITDLLIPHIDCDQIGHKINEKVGLGGESFWTNACDSGLDALGNLVENEIADIDNDQTILTIGGQTKMADFNNDGFYDQMNQGIWTGTFSMGDGNVQLSNNDNTFSGVRKN